MEFAIFGRLTQTTDFRALDVFFQFLQQQHIVAKVYDEYAEELQAVDYQWSGEFFRQQFSKMGEVETADFFFSLGGDGTLLDAIRYTVKANLPVVGVNFGRLGFLTSSSQEDLVEVCKGLMQGAYRIDRRAMIEVDSQPRYNFGGHNYGLNEVTIHKATSNEMIVIHTFINGEFLNTFWADGLIISSPTGSTAYNLASGGPIIMPGSDVFVITPIAPHSLTVRPFIIPDDAVVSFEIESRSGNALVAVDSRTELVESNIELAVRRAKTNARLVRVNAPSYFSTLRQRLNWGFDVRN